MWTCWTAAARMQTSQLCTWQQIWMTGKRSLHSARQVLTLTWVNLVHWMILGVGLVKRCKAWSGGLQPTDQHHQLYWHDCHHHHYHWVIVVLKINWRGFGFSLCNQLTSIVIIIITSLLTLPNRHHWHHHKNHCHYHHPIIVNIASSQHQCQHHQQLCANFCLKIIISMRGWRWWWYWITMTIIIIIIIRGCS